MKLKKRLLVCTLLLICICSLAGCKKGSQKDNEKSGKLSVVTTIFPYYDFVKNIAGDKVELSMIVPAGQDLHSFKPDSTDMSNVLKADVLIYNSGTSEKWVDSLLKVKSKEAKKIKGPVLIHCKTIKGKGYPNAEKNPDKYHSVPSFDISTGELVKEKDYSEVFGNKLVELAQKNKNIVAITAAMATGTGLSKFKKLYPDRFFDVEIAEQHALTMAAGMAKSGLIPVVAMYSSFLQRGYDQIIHDICMQNLHVVICVDRAGIVGNDGKTHQGLFDIAFLRLIPNITILAPKGFKELEDMLEYAINELNTPVVIRYPRGREEIIEYKERSQLQRLKNKKAEILKHGKDVTIIASGKMVSKAIKVAEKLNNIIECEVINASFLKPLDEETLKQSIEKTKYVLTIEDGVLNGGLYTEIAELITKYSIQGVKVEGCAYKEGFVKQGTINELERLNHLDVESITAKIIKLLGKEN